MTAPENHPLLEKLTAVLMDEADAATVEEITQALASDSDLAAIATGLRATITLVQNELGVGATLPRGRVDDLLTSAHALSESRIPAALPDSGVGALMRAAAAVVILSGGVWGALQFAGQDQVLITDEAAQDERIASIARANLMGQLLYRQAHPRQASGQVDASVLGRYQDLAAQERYAIEQEGFLKGLGEVEEEELSESGGPVHVESLVRDRFTAGVPRGGVTVTGDAAGLSGKGWGNGKDEKYGGRGIASAPQTTTSTPVPGAPPGLAGEVFLGSVPAAKSPPVGGGGGGSYFGPSDGVPPSSKAGLLDSSRPSLGRLKKGQPSAPSPNQGPSTPAPVASGLQALGYSVGSTGGRNGVKLGIESKGAVAEKRSQKRQLSALKVVVDMPVDRRNEFGEFDDLLVGHTGSKEVLIDLEIFGDEAQPVRQPIHLPSYEETVNQRFQEARRRCLVNPQEPIENLYQHWWGDNSWELTLADSQATFGADVDTASYGAARNKLNRNQLPGRAGIRTEEFVNYFRPDLPAPTTDALGLSVEMAPSLSSDGNDRWLLRVGVRAKDIQAWERDPLALVLVVDVSGSMKHHDRMGIVKRAVARMLDNLDSRDTLAIVTFSKEATQVLPPTSVSAREVILAAAESFTPGGGTNAALGLQMGYELAAQGVAPGVISRVVLLSDGLANTGETDQAKILESVREHLNAGVHLNTLGVGIEGHNDTFLERLADGGDGLCDFVDDDRAIQRALGERFAGAFIPVADDVKIQVEFNGRQVVRWRQLGYENRAIADASFRDDAVDAGEVGAGHQVTALFEVELDRGLVYDGTPLGTVRVRWKEPKVGGQDNSLRTATERSLPIMAQDVLAHQGSTSAGYRRAAVTAQFAEFLRRSVHVRTDSVPSLLRAAEALLHDRELAQDEDTMELVGLIQKAVSLGLEDAQLSNAVQAATDDLREIEHVCRQLDSLPGHMNTGDRNRLGSARRQAQERLRLAIEEDERGARDAAGWSQSGILLVEGQEAVRRR